MVSLVFCHRSSENPLALLSDIFPNLHIHFTSALLPPPLTTCYSLFPQDVKSVPLSFWFMISVMWECMYGASINPAVHVEFDVIDRLVIYSPHFPWLSFAGFSPILSKFSFVLPLLGCSSRLLKLSWPYYESFLFFFSCYSLAVEQKQ